MSLVTFTAGTKAKASEVNNNFTFLSPVGSVVSWLKNFTNTPALPDNWVECNGQVLSDLESVYDGQTIPDLNGDNRFLRGNSTSGATGGAATHTLTIAQIPSHNHTNTEMIGRSGSSGSNPRGGVFTNQTNPIGFTGGGSAHNNEPQYYNIVWIMRVK